MAAGGSDSDLITRARSPRACRGYLAFFVAFVILFGADGSRQPTSGRGWRLLGYQRGVAGRDDVMVIPDQAALNEAWDSIRIRSAPPTLPSDATTFWVTATGTLGCPTHFAGLQADPGTITAMFTRGLTSGCDGMHVPDSFLLAVDRSAAPAATPYRFTGLGPDGRTEQTLEIAP